MKLGIVGGGTVGRALARAFLEHADVRVHDRIKERSTHSITETLACDLVFLCLPTPRKEGSLECDLSAVEGFFEEFTRNVGWMVGAGPAFAKDLDAAAG